MNTKLHVYENNTGIILYESSIGSHELYTRVNGVTVIVNLYLKGKNRRLECKYF